jgi:hypothetical protein
MPTLTKEEFERTMGMTYKTGKKVTILSSAPLPQILQTVLDYISFMINHLQITGGYNSRVLQQILAQIVLQAPAEYGFTSDENTTFLTKIANIQSMLDILTPSTSSTIDIITVLKDLRSFFESIGLDDDNDCSCILECCEDLTCKDEKCHWDSCCGEKNAGYEISSSHNRSHHDRRDCHSDKRDCHSDKRDCHYDKRECHESHYIPNNRYVNRQYSLTSIQSVTNEISDNSMATSATYVPPSPYKSPATTVSTSTKPNTFVQFLSNTKAPAAPAYTIPSEQSYTETQYQQYLQEAHDTWVAAGGAANVAATRNYNMTVRNLNTTYRRTNSINRTVPSCCYEESSLEVTSKPTRNHVRVITVLNTGKLRQIVTFSLSRKGLGTMMATMFSNAKNLHLNQQKQLVNQSSSSVPSYTGPSNSELWNAQLVWLYTYTSIIVHSFVNSTLGITFCKENKYYVNYTLCCQYMKYARDKMQSHIKEGKISVALQSIANISLPTQWYDLVCCSDDCCDTTLNADQYLSRLEQILSLEDQ